MDTVSNTTPNYNLGKKARANPAISSHPPEASDSNSLALSDKWLEDNAPEMHAIVKSTRQHLKVGLLMRLITQSPEKLFKETYLKQMYHRSVSEHLLAVGSSYLIEAYVPCEYISFQINLRELINYKRLVPQILQNPKS